MQDGVSFNKTTTTPVRSVLPQRDLTVRVLERALAILDFFRDHPVAGVTEIARALQLHKSTVHRLLASLERAGYVVQDPQTEQYRLGLKVLDLAQSLLPYLNVQAQAEPVMQRLMAETGETVHLGVLIDFEAVCLESVVSPRPVAITRMAGKRTKAHVSSMGKVLLAFQEPDVIERFLDVKGLPQLTPRTITDPDVFRQHLAVVRRQGYALNDEEEEIGIRCVAAPVFNHRGHVVAALSVAAPSPRLEGARLAEIVQQTMRAAQEVSRALGAPTMFPATPETQTVSEPSALRSIRLECPEPAHRE
jgi:IclR family KDG regulon transcriptional repressor